MVQSLINKIKKWKGKFLKLAGAEINNIQLIPSVILTMLVTISIFIFLVLLMLPSFISASQTDTQQIMTVDSCKRIESVGSYILSNDILDFEFEKTIGGCLIFDATNIEFDCRGHKIFTSSDKAVGITINKNNATVKNCILSMQNGTGIASLQSTNTKIFNNTLQQNKYALFLYGSSNNEIIENSFEKNQFSITLTTSSNNNNIIKNNIDESETYAILSSGSSNNIFSNLKISNIGGDAFVFRAGSYNNIIKNILISRTNLDNSDINFTDTENNNNTIIDSNFGKYDFNKGNIVNFIESNFGEISFLQPISGTGKNLSEDIKILNNIIAISENQGGLNKEVRLTFFNIPRDLFNYTILKNDFPCPQNLCSNETSLDAGTVKIKVNGSGIYKISASHLEPEAPNPFCIDSDNGLDYNTKGNVSYLTKITQSSGSIQNPGNIELTTYGASTSFDYCITNMTLVEYSCFTNETGSFPNSIRYICPFGCSNSTCLNSIIWSPNESIPPLSDKPKKSKDSDIVRFIPSSPRFTIYNISFVDEEELNLEGGKAIVPVKNNNENLNSLLIFFTIFNVAVLLLILAFIFFKRNILNENYGQTQNEPKSESSSKSNKSAKIKNK